MIDLHLVDICVALAVRCWTDDFFSALSKLIGKVLSSAHISLLKLVLLHSMANEEVVWHTTLIEFNIILEIFILLLV